MRRLLFIMFAAASLFTGTLAQQATPTPASTPPPIPVPQETPINLRSRTGISSINNQMTDGRPNLTPNQELAVKQLLLQKYTRPLYRKPSESELASIAPDPGLIRHYKLFLERRNTGIVRLVADAGCNLNAKVIVATEQCLKYTMPGNGNSFSFRIANYRIRHLADLMLTGENFMIPGIMMHGMMTRLGDVPIEQVNLQTAGVQFLTEFKPTNEYERAIAIEDLILSGLGRDGFVYARSIPVVDNTTYALRVVAYDGKVMRAVPGAEYNEMDYDRRRDMVVAFRVVQRDRDAGVTIVWAELSNSDSPKLKLPAVESNLVKSEK